MTDQCRMRPLAMSADIDPMPVINWSSHRSHRHTEKVEIVLWYMLLLGQATSSNVTKSGQDDQDATVERILK